MAREEFAECVTQSDIFSSLLSDIVAGKGRCEVLNFFLGAIELKLDELKASNRVNNPI